MIIQVRFGAAQTGLGYQFYDSSGALIASRVTAGISALPETGAYIASATVPANAVGVYWNSTGTGAQASEDLREAIADPFSTVVPASYADGTAGAAIGRLNNTPPDTPIIIIPDPSGDANDCVVYIDTQEIDNTITAGVVVRFRLSGAGKTSSGVVLGYKNDRVAVTDNNGRATIALERTDAITPSGLTYHVFCERYGIDSNISLAADTYNLATLIS